MALLRNSQRIVLASIGLATALIISCTRDQATAPQGSSLRPPIRAGRDLIESPLSASATVPARTTQDGMPADSAEIGFYPMPTIVELQIQQSISIDPVPGVTGGGGLAIAGTGCGGGDAIVWVPAPGGLPPAFAGCQLWGLDAGHETSWTDTIQVKQHAFVRHNSFAGGGCPTCFTYNGSTTATLRRLDYNFVIAAAPYTGGLFYDSLSVNVGDSVTFEMLAQPNEVNFRNFWGNVSTTSDSSQWQFVADDGDVLTGCPVYFWFTTCARVMTKSGTMHLNGYVNGAFKAELRAIHVTVRPVPHIAVTCSPTTVVRASSTPVSCTASATGTVAITRWNFTASDPNVGSFTTNRTSNSWSGMAVASGSVTVEGTVNGVTAVSDVGQFTVTPRTSGWSWSAAKSSGVAVAPAFDCFGAPHYATDLFGWTRADSTCRSPTLLLWPDYDGKSSPRGYTIAQVPAGGPNAGFWYATSDKTGMHIRAQVLADLRPNATNKYPVNGTDTVAKQCKSAKVNASATVTVVNNTCMKDPSPTNFGALYTFLVNHETCHLTQFMNAFPSIPDPRTRLETIVRADTGSFHQAATRGPGSYAAANDAINQANTIDQSGPSWKFWSRNVGNITTQENTSWVLRIYAPKAFLPPVC